MSSLVPSVVTYGTKKCSNELFVPASLPGETPGPSYVSQFAALAAVPTFESLYKNYGKRSQSGMFTFGMPNDSEQASALLLGSQLLLERDSGGLGGLAQYRVVSESETEITLDLSVWVIDRGFDRVLASQRSLVAIAKTGSRYVPNVGPALSPAPRIDARKIKR